MRVLSKSTLAAFWERHRETERPLKDWLDRVQRSSWSSMGDVRAAFPKASVINAERVVFDVCGGNYRLIVAIKFSAGIVFVKFLGTHREYDRVNAATIGRPRRQP